MKEQVGECPGVTKHHKLAARNCRHVLSPRSGVGSLKSGRGPAMIGDLGPRFMAGHLPSLHVCVLARSVASVVSNSSAAPWTVARLAPLSMGILQAGILEWVAMPSSRGSSRPKGRTCSSCSSCSSCVACGLFFAEPPRKPLHVCTCVQTSLLIRAPSQ